jgi:hypothetical protein
MEAAWLEKRRLYVPIFVTTLCTCRLLVVTGSDECLACKSLNQNGKTFLLNEVAPAERKG